MRGTRKFFGRGLKPSGFLLGTVLLSAYVSAHATSLGSKDHFPQEPPENLWQEVSAINPEFGKITDCLALPLVELKPAHRRERETTLLDGAVRFFQHSRRSLSLVVRDNYKFEDHRLRHD